MKAFVDPELCIGCTQCAGLCPEVYQMVFARCLQSVDVCCCALSPVFCR